MVQCYIRSGVAQEFQEYDDRDAFIQHEGSSGLAQVVKEYFRDVGLYDDQVEVQAQVAGIEGGANVQWGDQSDSNDIYEPVYLVRSNISRRSTAYIRQGSLDSLIH